MTRVLDELEAADPEGRAELQPAALELATRLLRAPGGVEVLYELAPRFDPAGLFDGGDWALPDKLQADFVAGTLHSADVHDIALECLSELRMLALALGDEHHEAVSPEAARAFLEDVLAYNLDLLFPDHGEVSRVRGGQGLDIVYKVFQLHAASLGLGGVLGSLIEEAERVLEQRPILVDRVGALLDTAVEAMSGQGAPEVRARASRLLHARHGPTGLARETGSAEEYGRALADLSSNEVYAEAEAFAQSMRRTGLVCAQHATLLRFLNERQPAFLGSALALDAVGRGSLHVHGALVRRVVDAAVHPATAQCIYGLARMLERGVLYFHPAATGLRRLIGLELRPESERALRGAFDGAVTPGAALVAGALQVLGQPLGVGQGDNPTCQSARAISLWSQSDTGYLLELITRAARDGEIVMHFEGRRLVSSELPAGLADELHTELDPVSLVLVPHLDRIYAEMLRLVDDRDEDAHRWVNPEFHGWWVHRGFAAAVGEMTGAVTDFEAFVRRFFAAYHPEYNGDRQVVYPQPAGIAITDLWATLVGWHAVSIQRVEHDDAGEPRVYFYNPNNDGRHKWGQGIETSTGGLGEEPGESSLPFHEYASRTYVFHYNPREQGDPDQVPQWEVDRVRELARTSWAADRPWDDDV